MPIKLAHLPSELKQAILRHLNWDDLSTMCLVSRCWRKEAEDPKLWEDFGKLFNWSVEPIASHKELKTVLKMKRFQALKHIAIHEKFSFTESSLQLLLDQNLVSLDLRYCNLDSAPSDLLTTLLAGLEIIKLRGSIKNSCMVELFTKLKASNKLKNLNWLSGDYTCLDPSLLASVLSRLDCGNWDYSTRCFTPTQWEHLFSAIAARNNPIKWINFDSTRLSYVSPGVLARGLVNVETLNLQYTYLTKEQVTEFFTLISVSGSRIKKLDFSWEGSNQGKVDPTVLASAVNKLEDVCFGYSRLQPSQIEAILLGVDANSTLKSLDLRSGWTFVCEGNQAAGEEEKNWKTMTLAPLLVKARKHCEVLI